MCEKHQQAVRTLAEQAIIDRERVGRIVTEDLDMRKVCARMVQKTCSHSTVPEAVYS
jgi:hypothetical protein